MSWGAWILTYAASKNYFTSKSKKSPSKLLVVGSWDQFCPHEASLGWLSIPNHQTCFSSEQYMQHLLCVLVRQLFVVTRCSRFSYAYIGGTLLTHNTLACCSKYFLLLLFLLCVLFWYFWSFWARVGWIMHTDTEGGSALQLARIRMQTIVVHTKYACAEILRH